MNKKRKEIIGGNEISRLVTYSLGGYQQKVLLDGKHSDSPIVIVLHGGPGSPIPFSAGARGLFPEFTDNFIMVCWDQLGCGINNKAIDNSFNIDTFVNMTTDLIKAIKNDFPANKLILFGISWGSILAAKAALAVPSMIDNVITYGQIIKNLTFNDEVYDALDKSSISKKHRNKLNVIKASDTHTCYELKSVMGFIRKYTEGYFAKSGKSAPIGKTILGIMSSPDYSFKNFTAMFINGYSKNTSLLKELISVDLTDELKNVTIPYMIVKGSTDIVTSTKFVSEFISASQNENLKFRLIQNSGHIPSAEAMEAITSELNDIIKAER